VAHAGNQDSAFLGNVAATTGGAVTAVIRDGEAAWYNPAGLGGTGQQSIDASASAFMLRIRNIPRLTETELLDGSRLPVNIDSTEIFSIPSALTYTRALSDSMWFAVSVFVPAQDQLSMRHTAQRKTANAAGTEVDYRQHVALEAKESAYFAGPSLSGAVSPDVRIGGSLFIVYGSVDTSLEVWSELRGSTDREFVAFGQIDTNSEASFVGAQGVFGIQANVGEGFQLGCTLRTPVLSFVEWGETVALAQESFSGTAELPASTAVEFDETDDSAGTFELAVPARLHLGAAWQGAHTWVGLELDVTHPLSDDPFFERWIVNGRLGGRTKLTESLTLGLGVFTDLSGSADPKEEGADKIDYFGGTVGLELRKPFALGGENDGRDLIFSSTFALRYAAGVGSIVGSISRPFDDTGAASETRSIDLLFHEVALHIGSAVYF
jgi:hypothetical protein